MIHKGGLPSKTDLTTELVKEFTELQGIVGGLYARATTRSSMPRQRGLLSPTRFMITISPSRPTMAFRGR